MDTRNDSQKRLDALLRASMFITNLLDAQLDRGAGVDNDIEVLRLTEVLAQVEIAIQSRR